MREAKNMKQCRFVIARLTSTSIVVRRLHYAAINSSTQLKDDYEVNYQVNK